MENISTTSKSGARLSQLLACYLAEQEGQKTKSLLERLDNRKERKDEEGQSAPVDELGSGLVND